MQLMVSATFQLSDCFLYFGSQMPDTFPTCRQSPQVFDIILMNVSYSLFPGLPMEALIVRMLPDFYRAEILF